MNMIFYIFTKINFNRITVLIFIAIALFCVYVVYKCAFDKRKKNGEAQTPLDGKNKIEKGKISSSMPQKVGSRTQFSMDKKLSEALKEQEKTKKE